jgi:hypothetical protein
VPAADDSSSGHPEIAMLPREVDIPSFAMNIAPTEKQRCAITR